MAMQKIRGLSGLENIIKKRNSTNRNNNQKATIESHSVNNINENQDFDRKPSFKSVGKDQKQLLQQQVNQKKMML